MSKEVTINAGIDCSYASNTGTTTAVGNMSVADGTVIIQSGSLAIQ